MKNNKYIHAIKLFSGYYFFKMSAAAKDGKKCAYNESVSNIKMYIDKADEYNAMQDYQMSISMLQRAVKELLHLHGHDKW